MYQVRQEHFGQSLRPSWKLGRDGKSYGKTSVLPVHFRLIIKDVVYRPRFRDNARVNLGQNYRSVGKQFLLLPDPARYLTDRLVSVNIPVPSINNILQISSEELLSALNEVFLIDTFSISTVPVAIRSFIHHFYPAYLDPFLEYAYKSDPAKETFMKEEYKDP